MLYLFLPLNFFYYTNEPKLIIAHSSISFPRSRPASIDNDGPQSDSLLPTYFPPTCTVLPYRALPPYRTIRTLDHQPVPPRNQTTAYVRCTCRVPTRAHQFF